MESSDISSKAQRYYDITIGQWGAEQQEVCLLLQQVYDSGLKREFETAVYNLIPDDLENTRGYYLAKGNGDVVRGIFREELEGSWEAKAEDIYAEGKDFYSAGGWEYFKTGLCDSVDLSSTTSQLWVAGSTGVLILGTKLLTRLWAAASAVAVSRVVAAGFIGYGLGTTGLYGVQAATDEDERQKQDLYESGKGLGIGLTAGLGLALTYVPGAKNAANRPGKGMPEEPTLVLEETPSKTPVGPERPVGQPEPPVPVVCVAPKPVPPHPVVKTIEVQPAGAPSFEIEARVVFNSQGQVEFVEFKIPGNSFFRANNPIKLGLRAIQIFMEQCYAQVGLTLRSIELPKIGFDASRGTQWTYPVPEITNEGWVVRLIPAGVLRQGGVAWQVPGASVPNVKVPAKSILGPLLTQPDHPVVIQIPVAENVVPLPTEDYPIPVPPTPD